jgi:hypothetical protein
MANYHLDVVNVSRGRRKGSGAGRLAYHRGERFRDNYKGVLYDYSYRTDIVHKEIILAENAPYVYLDPQLLVDEVDRAEARKDSRTFKEVRGSLPNELSMEENVKIAQSYVTENFVSEGMCVSLVLHEGKNEIDPAKNNPHFHALLTTRPINEEGNGFSKKKNRSWNERANILRWRESLATIVNKFYSRNGLKIRVSHESYIRQGKEQEATKRLPRIDYEREKRGEHTACGDRNRAIKARNAEREKERLRKERELARRCEIQQRIQREFDRSNEYER